jgi:hypothetical protein
MTRKNYVLAGLFLLAAVLIAAGLFQGQPVQVLNKAINICLECVGLG